MKTCINCNIEKELTEFSNKRNDCKICHNQKKYCDHEIRKEYCAYCGGSALCIHKNKKSKCEECKQIKNNIDKKICKECNIEQNINEFRKLRNVCKTCNKNKKNCKHKIRKEYCIECEDGGSAICKHKIRKCRCKECGGSELCNHGKEKQTCIECYPTTNKRCKGQGGLCTILATVKKFKGFCSRCFFFTFPDEPITKNYKTKENSVVDFIKPLFNQYDIVYDKQIQDGCTRRRPDILFDFGEKVIIIEVDENQHRDYDTTCEQERLNNLMEDINYRNLILIKFNPDYYKSGPKKINSPWKMNKKNGILEILNNKEWSKRLNTLKEVLENNIKEDTTELFKIIPLFYDT